MTKIIILKAKRDNHYRISYNGDGPYSISSTSEVPVEEVVKRIENCNPHATVEVEK